MSSKTKRDFDRIHDNNMRYAVDYDYDTYYPCQNGSDCCDNDYCRCGVINNARAKVDVNTSYSIACTLTRNQTLRKDPRFYCLERWISCVLRETPDCFDVSVGGGYYGQEVYGVSINWQQANDINTFVELLKGRLTKSKTRELVEKTLEREYGWVLAVLEEKDWQYDTVPVKNIAPGNTEYRSMDNNAVARYADQYSRHNGDLLSCLCKRELGNGNKYVLVDGYHRFAAAKRRGDKNMRVMWCEV